MEKARKDKLLPLTLLHIIPSFKELDVASLSIFFFPLKSSQLQTMFSDLLWTKIIDLALFNSY